MRYTHGFCSLLWVVLALAALAFPVEAQVAPGRPIVGVAAAIVVDTTDPEAAGPLKVVFPWLRDRGEAETWARVSLPLGRNATGSWSLAEVGDEVLVAFEHGDLRRPVVLGSLWNGAGPCRAMAVVPPAASRAPTGSLRSASRTPASLSRGRTWSCSSTPPSSS